jgi:hypothetical protein
LDSSSTTSSASAAISDDPAWAARPSISAFAGFWLQQQREIAETLFERNQRRETEINDALKQEYARREATIKNMYRLRALRSARDYKINDAASSVVKV